jgi:HEAT repeat protein
LFQPSSLHRTLEACLRDVGHKSPRVRASAVRDLVAHADVARTKVIGALDRALRDPSAGVRSSAAIALADSGGVEALAALLCAIEDDDPFVRQMAIAAVGEMRDPRSRERLRRALGDERPEVRFQAVIAFVRVAPDEAEEAILAALSDPDPSIRYVAIRVAEEHREGGAIAGVSMISALVGDDDADVRIAAAIALARSGDDRGSSILLDVAAKRSKPKEADDEAAALEMVGEMGLRAAMPHLEQRAFGLMARLGREAFSFHALVALARMGHARASSQIVSDLGARSRDRRTLAVAAAGRARLLSALPLIEAMRGDGARAEQDAVVEALEALVPQAHLQFPERERSLP